MKHVKNKGTKLRRQEEIFLSATKKKERRADTDKKQDWETDEKEDWKMDKRHDWETARTFLADGSLLCVSNEGRCLKERQRANLLLEITYFFRLMQIHPTLAD